MSLFSTPGGEGDNLDILISHGFLLTPPKLSVKLVFGDSATDISLFELFPHCVFITNPRLSTQQRQGLKKIAKYVSDLPVEEGFVEVVSHIIKIRTLEA